MEKGQGKGTDTLQTDNVLTRKEYIERNAAISVIAKISNESDMPVDWHKGMSVAMSAVCRIPAADVAPVRHGRWIEREDMYYGWNIWECSVCREEFCVEEGTPKDNEYNYCPNCGARMDGDGE